MNKKKKSTNTSPYPDEAIDRLARAFYPAILACWNSEEASGHLSGKAPPSCLRKTVRSLKSPTGAFIAPLRCANASLPRGRRNRLISLAKKTERSRWGTPCCTYRYRMWILAGCVFRGAPCFCFAFNFLTHGFRPPACMICYRLVAGSVIFRFLPMQAWQGSHRGGWW